jgi:hypothetical protein
MEDRPTLPASVRAMSARRSCPARRARCPFDGRASIVIPVGESVWSDEVDMRIRAGH